MPTALVEVRVILVFHTVEGKGWRHPKPSVSGHRKAFVRFRTFFSPGYLRQLTIDREMGKLGAPGALWRGWDPLLSQGFACHRPRGSVLGSLSLCAQEAKPEAASGETS